MAPVLIAAGFPFVYFCHNVPCLIVSALLVGSGLACSNAPSTQVILGFAPRGMRAFSASLDITFARLGGVATVGLLAQTMFGFAALSIGLLCILAFVFALVAVRNFHVRNPTENSAA